MTAPSYIGTDGTCYPLDVPRWRGDDGGPLAISDLPGIGRDRIATGERSLWRYAAVLPFPIAAPISFGEGCTPLVRRRFAGGTPLFKLDYVSPTGSFKDRGAAVMISALRQLGVDRVLEDSSGNGGAAIAAYAAAGGLGAKILAPASTSPAKTVQMRAHGAEVELVPGSRQDTADEAVRQSARIFYASHNWQPLFLQGTKTLAYELWEDLGFAAPDNVVIPTGAGSNVLGCDIGFSELLRHGEIARRPRLFAAQPASCAPIDASFRAGAEGLVPIAISPTIAEGTAIAAPVRLGDVLSAIRRSGGGTVAITEEEIVATWRALAALGFYAEPTSATAAAAYAALIADGTIGPEETTVILLTGAGAKATPRIGELLGVL
ncbi:pyridoxal-phosphate dependent enzyme [Sphingomonas sp. DT-204]|uniref:pyridoxal-phosphate dependent enzyme n=1 Tax=Sphingomonas sp. DT-204 TaxID=3396166 RepID=UPI003F1B4E58